MYTPVSPSASRRTPGRSSRGGCPARGPGRCSRTRARIVCQGDRSELGTRRSIAHGRHHRRGTRSRRTEDVQNCNIEIGEHRAQRLHLRTNGLVPNVRSQHLLSLLSVSGICVCCRCCCCRGRRHRVGVGRLGPRRKHRRREVGVVEGVRAHVRGGRRGYVCILRRSSNIMIRNWRSAVIRGMPCCRGTSLSLFVAEIGLGWLRGAGCSLGRWLILRYRHCLGKQRELMVVS